MSRPAAGRSTATSPTVKRQGLRRLLPHPLLFLALLVMWLLLNMSVSPGQILLGSLIAYGAAWTMTAFDMEEVRLKRPAAMIRLAGRVLVDIFRSNLAVGRIILFGLPKGRSSGFMTVSLDLASHHGLAVLAIVLTATPGTLWMNYDPARGDLLLHVLDLDDEQHWIDLIKQRYERLLMEIFE
ncbi:Na+/H+ antiporter subunit E [Azorhizobium oxalatiphilum]|uniref:Na+/H+ antiporter subunit E n=1 Tax=Azorhizobium oxalatiphilum TaxID=980631 RepID=A0A917F6I5_9HYPH|nr:Na+/H+ antiporter subunit E [Azorhizobium oxalatiphilum]GGF51294.1 Na+/H+ antiporter subunit E [Azorhizobium oxalatiphilum]